MNPITAEYARELTRLNWIVMADDAKYLHGLAPDTADETLIEMVEDGAAVARSACDRTSHCWVPGVLDRLGMTGAERCPACCDALGLPHGVGSPKNDPACRSVLDLPATAHLPAGETTP